MVYLKAVKGNKERTMLSSTLLPIQLTSWVRNAKRNMVRIRDMFRYYTTFVLSLSVYESGRGRE